jgi:hypothetical protein
MAYGFKRSITIASAQVGSTDQTNFPVLVGGSSGPFAYLATVANGGNVQNTVTFNGQTVPADLIFTSDSAGTTLLTWEVASYTASTGAIEIWVQVPTVSHTADTVIYMFYGDASVTTYQGGALGAAWNSGFTLVNHYANGSTLTINDSKSGITPSSGGPTAAAGRIDGGASFDGSSNYIQYGSQSTLNGWTTQTISFWIKSTGGSMVQYARLAEKGTNNEWAVFFNNVIGSNKITYQPPGASVFLTSPSAVCDGTFHKVDVCIHADYFCEMYIDGSSAATLGAQTAPSTKTNTLRLGEFGGGGGYLYNGILDEFRISDGSVVRSADWLLSEFNNQKSGATFVSISGVIAGSTFFQRRTLSTIGTRTGARKAN